MEEFVSETNPLGSLQIKEVSEFQDEKAHEVE